MRDLVSCYSDHAVKVAEFTCSGGGRSSVSRSSRDSPVQSAVTCIYRTRMSTHKELLIRVTWPKSLIGQGFSIAIDDISDDDEWPPTLTANPLLLRKKKGSRSYGATGGSVIGLYWDITSAKYGSGPEPVAGYYVIVVADAELALLVGDMSREHMRKFEGTMRMAEFSMISRREQVLGKPMYSTRARFRDNGWHHDISIHWESATEPELSVSIDNMKVVQVKRLKWNFRGNQTIFIDGLPVDMMWDVHDWWFSSSGGGDAGRAVFMFRTRSALESRLWLEEEMVQSRKQGKGGFTLLIHAIRSP